MPGSVPDLGFDTEAEEAAAVYASVFDDARIVSVSHYGESGRARRASS